MSLKRLANLSLVAGLLFAFSTALPVFADDAKPEYKSTKRCKDSDRTNSDNEEKTEGDNCPGSVPTPEPVSIILFSAGLAGVGFVARRRLRKAE